MEDQGANYLWRHIFVDWFHSARYVCGSVNNCEVESLNEFSEGKIPVESCKILLNRSDDWNDDEPAYYVEELLEFIDDLQRAQ